MTFLSPNCLFTLAALGPIARAQSLTSSRTDCEVQLDFPHRANTVYPVVDSTYYHEISNTPCLG